LSLFGELKRRNVFRVGIAYAVAAWILIQVADTLIPMLGLPEWAPRLVLLILVIGFVPALIFAWAFELTPDGIRRDKDVDPDHSIAPQTGKKLNNAILVLLALAVAYLLFDKFSGARPEAVSTPAVEVADNSAQPEAALAPDTEPTVSRRSIAVLPFDNRSKLEDDAFFVEGIHDDLLTNLARIGGLKVISRTSVSRYLQTEKSIPEIAGELGVATVMEGAVQRSGSQVRINVQLIDAQTDEHLWAEIFDRELTADNLFAIQSEISSEIAKALSTTLSPEEQRRVSDRPTENLAAYSAYLRGRQLMARRSSAELNQAEKEFQQAVELDPEFALAWVAIAENALHQTSYAAKDLVLARQQRQEAVDKALALNDQLGEAHLSRATLLVDANRPKDAEDAFKRAIELSPGYAMAYQWYGDFLEDFPHRFDEAGEMLRKALELDPMSSVIRVNLGNHQRVIGRLEQAEATIREVIRLDPGFASAYGALARIAFQRGQYDEELRWRARLVELDPGNINGWARIMWSYMWLGETEPFEKIRQRAESIDEQNVAVGWVDAYQTMYADKPTAALEHLDWIYQRSGAEPFMYRFKGYMHNHMRNFERARTAWEISDPEFFDRARWREGIEDTAEQGCRVADILIRTGDEETGRALAQQALDYLENELPQYIEHADRWGIEDCYLALGQHDQAMDAIEKRVEHGHGFGWFFMRKEPQYEPLWGTARFEAVWQKIQDDLVGQRERAAVITRELGL
jgi:TolB-like protein/Tfp pilus assembly protein PilF